MKNAGLIKGLNVMKTMQNTKRRSVSKVQASPYIDLYILNKEKDRLLKEDERLSLRTNVIKRRMEEINSDIKRLQKTEASVKPGEIKETKETKEGP